MGDGEHLLIFGASARAAAFSAVRAGLKPWCVDLFADADLCRLCPAQKLAGRYPGAFADLIDVDLPGPWLYTGGLENYPSLVDRMRRRRRLWGNSGQALRLARNPSTLQEVAAASGLPAPAISLTPPLEDGWLLKPLAGAGGFGIRPWLQGMAWPGEGYYAQQFIPGPSASVVYVAAAGACRLLGVTRQLVGEGWLHAPAFRYCGSVGPLVVADGLARALAVLGERITREAGLCGLFGIDGVLSDGAFWPVEVNPRYTASIEVLERATGLRSLRLHRLAFEDPHAALDGVRGGGLKAVVGKAVLYAKADVEWRITLPPHPLTPSPKEGEGGPEKTAPPSPSLGEGGWGGEGSFADVPHPGECIPAGRPILTLFADARDVDGCLDALRTRAAGVEALLYAGP